MTYALADRVLETSSTQGTGTLNLAGATAGFRSFVAGVGDGNTCSYTIEDGTDWEVGIGTVTAGSPDTLSRDTILASSNSNAAVDWGSGTRDVYIAPLAGDVLSKRRDETVTANYAFSGDNTYTGKVLYPNDGELTIATGVITITGVRHTVDTEADAISDDLDTISGGASGQVLIISPADDTRTIALKHATGNIKTPYGNDIILDSVDKPVFLQYNGTNWLVLASPSVELLDEDDMASDSDTKGVTQQSIKAYVDNIQTGFTLATPVATTSGTSIDLTGIPAGAKIITICFKGVSLNSTDDMLIQLIDADGVETTGYISSSTLTSSGINTITATNGFVINTAGNSSLNLSGVIILSLLDSSTNTWSAYYGFGRSGGASAVYGGGAKSLSDVITGIRLTSAAGSSTYNTGTVNISWSL